MIEIQKLNKKYKDTLIFENADYTFPNKGLICLVGASGSGKSTLLNLIAGFDSKYDGTIRVKDRNLNDLNAEQLCIYREQNIGFIFQDYHLLKGYSVMENILLPCELNTEQKNINVEYAEKLLELFGMLTKKNQKIENLSGGQKQRVAIARALINHPNIILADEPTGALDRKTSTEIMKVLHNISKEKLVIVITHDRKICDFADEILIIQDKKIMCEESKIIERQKEEKDYNWKNKKKLKSLAKVRTLKIGFKNFKIHLNRYLMISIIISISIFFFMLSLSFKNIIEGSIEDFKEKNTAFNNGYIKVQEAEFKNTLDFLNSKTELDNVYLQYKLQNIHLQYESNIVKLEEKYPMPKTKESMSYGVMPKGDKSEIALSPSLAKKFADNIQDLIGKQIEVSYQNIKYNLTVSGLFNADYDDFFVSDSIEKSWYKDIQTSPYSISYDVKEFDDIVVFSKVLSENNIKSINAAKEVEIFQNTFETINRLFLIVSILILCTSLFIISILLVKQQGSRYKEVGLLQALGFSKKNISKIVLYESLLLASIAVILNIILSLLAKGFCTIYHISFTISNLQLITTSLVIFSIILIISILTSYKLFNTEPAISLRK